MKKLALVLLTTLTLSACKQGNEGKLFRLISPRDHGITFQNSIFESDTLNILTLEYIYNGGGVAVADFNTDGLSDVFFTGNMVPNRLYINRGDLKFEDVSEKAGIMAPERWKSGVAAGDVNGDGLFDIYVCATIKPDSAKRQNMLFINQGAGDDGVPVFEDMAASYGVNYSGHSSGAAFLDYDNDNDLDLYVLTNTIEKGIPTSYRAKIDDGTTINADHLFRNNGDGTFTDVSREAGILHEGYGLGIAIADINRDGWQDMYVSNDYITNDLLYINNGNGTFSNRINDYIRHQSQFSMGNDVADINNDALPDIITLDMLPEGNLRRKTVITGTNYTSYINNEKYGYGHQYIRNMVHLNNGNGTFSEIGQMAGLHQTEWSWSPLFADFDNDGLRDAIITNGFPRDITDKDFGNFRSGPAGNIASAEYLLDSVPVVKVSNYVFRNNGDLTFKDVTADWGMTQASFSNGASFADFDNDGDLDYIINNINDPVFLYENTLRDGKADQRDAKFLRIRLEGNGKNISGLGTKVELRYRGVVQYHDHSIYRGYISTVEDIIHFGLDTVDVVDSVLVYWQDGKTSLLKDVKANQLVKIAYASSSAPVTDKAVDVSQLVRPVSSSALSFVHREKDIIDFNLQRTIPHKFSQNGPGMAVADVNGDGLEDFYVGGASGFAGQVYLQDKAGNFKPRELKKGNTNGDSEDQGALFFDADMDNDVDLYVVSGTFELPDKSPLQQDRLYRNDGKGNFSIDEKGLPATMASGSCVRGADVDRDGDLDLFVGGRVVPGSYPIGSDSYLLINDKGTFRDETESLAPALRNAGMVTDALWTDIENDGDRDLILATEFSPLRVFRNDNGKLSQIADSGLDRFSGWWNSLGAADFDRDGDTDFVAGNLGLNNYYKASDKTPLRVYAKDFDGNNSVDAILTCYLRSEEGDMKEFPVHFWDELNSQSPKFRRKFDYYKKFGRATLDMLLTPEDRRDAIVLETNYTASSYVENLGNGKFALKALPMLAQVAPVNGIVTDDVNADGMMDVLLVGNDYGNEVFTGRHDAFAGLILLGDGKGSFAAMSPARSGFIVDRDAKALVKLYGRDGMMYLASQNRDTLKAFTSLGRSAFRVFTPLLADQYALVSYADGRTEKVEFCFGSGYLSQSTRRLLLSPSATKVVVYNTGGESREVPLPAF